MSSGNLTPFLDALDNIVYGQRQLFKNILVAMLTGGHILLEGPPGVAKTTAVRTLSAALGLSFSRLQFTSDLLPGDVTGVQLFRPEKLDFVIRRGPVFANLVLADEINRAPAKVQSALLQAMEERAVTIAGETIRLPDPFVVLATQNPLEQEGTYQLPEAQLDRFMLKVLVSYPESGAERKMLAAALQGQLAASPAELLSAAELADCQAAVTKVTLSEEVQTYMQNLVAVTRQPRRYSAELADLLSYGISPRGLLHLALAARAHAYLEGRDFVTPDDVQLMLPVCWRHRLGLSFAARAEGVGADEILRQIVHLVPVL